MNGLKLSRLALTALVVLPGLLGVSVAGATPAKAKVMIVNAAGPAGLVDVYVNGQLVTARLFPGADSFFPRELAAGNFEVVVTRSGHGMTAAMIRKKMDFSANTPQKLTLSANANGELSLEIGTLKPAQD